MISKIRERLREKRRHKLHRELGIAMTWNDLPMMEKIIFENGIDPNEKYAATRYERSFFQEAVMCGHIDTVKLMLKAGGDVFSPIFYGMRYYDLLEAASKPEIEQMIIQARKDAKVVSKPLSPKKLG